MTFVFIHINVMGRNGEPFSMIHRHVCWSGNVEIYGKLHIHAPRRMVSVEEILGIRLIRSFKR